MKCPIDGTELVMSERSGVEIDYCPQCRGVWLDRGELDKIIARAAQQADLHPPTPPAQYGAGTPPPAGYGTPPQGWHDDDDDDYRRYPQQGQGTHGRKRKSFLDDIFDFG